ncbi:MAG: ribbon-helix-helix domain-containing protein [Candidatus Poribacteria bacterium]|nr:ribbon-helix-helix domain-containing protein [Candidatus Poribacteria bacterium]
MATLTKRPIQVYLEERQHQALRRLAADESVSLSELIRRGINLLLAKIPIEKDPAWKIIGLGSSGVNDAATRHDQHIVEELCKEMNR